MIFTLLAVVVGFASASLVMCVWYGNRLFARAKKGEKHE